jgi:DNA-binding beta-propeller fold protein YncE
MPVRSRLRSTTLRKAFITKEVYPRGATAPSLTITQGVVAPQAMALGSDGNLYIANCPSCQASLQGKGPKPHDSIGVYSTSTGALLSSIKHGVKEPRALAFDYRDELFVANYASNSITVYAIDTKKLKATIKTGVENPVALLTSDAAEYLYVADVNAVTVYDYHGFRWVQSFTQAIAEPAALALVGDFEVYVANAGDDTVTSYFYTGSGVQFIDRIKKGISKPMALAFGP